MGQDTLNGDTGQRLLLPVDICLVSGEDICPVSAADICPVSTADICPVSTEDIYPVSTEDIHPVSAEDFLFKAQKRGLALNGENGPKWVQNGRQVLRIHPNESHRASEASATSPAAQNNTKMGRNPEIGHPGGGSRVRLLTG